MRQVKKTNLHNSPSPRNAYKHIDFINYSVKYNLLVFYFKAPSPSN